MDYDGKNIITTVTRPRHGLIRYVSTMMIPYAAVVIIGPLLLMYYLNPTIFAEGGMMYWIFAALSQRLPGFVLPLLPYVGGVLIAGVISLNRYNYNLDLLKILSIDEHGIVLGRQGEESRDCSLLVRWTDVVAVNAVHSGAEFDSTKSWLMIESHFNRVYKIRWDNATSWVDSSLLLSKLRTFAPHVEASNLIPEKRALENSHTRLWLEYFSPPGKRNRTTKLVEGDTLHNGVYKIVGQVGAGGQGTAYLAAKIDDDNSPVVLKEYVLPVHKGDQMSVERVALLNRESEILSKIDHQDIVKLIDCFVEDHRGYMVLEYVEGETLRQIVKREGKQNEETVRAWAGMICRIVEYLHGLEPPIIHRDITPDNLILQKNGRIKLVDFTVAHQFDSSGGATIVGKQAYIPPEQFQGEPCPQSDLYAVGSTLYFLLAGEDPSPMETSHPKTKVESLSDEIDDIVARATAFSVTDRFANASELLAAITV